MDAHNRITSLLDGPDSLHDHPSPVSPTHPHTLPLQHPTPAQASRLLRLFLTDGASILDICECAECTLEELDVWAESDWAQRRFEIIRKLSNLRDEIILADAIPQTRQILLQLATLPDPAESATSRESRRKSALALTQANPDTPPPPSQFVPHFISSHFVSESLHLSVPSPNNPHALLPHHPHHPPRPPRHHAPDRPRHRRLRYH
ncbi:MAG: hypothetical protein IPJ41_12075 [Phycisphaerales bacterium]|nr:hypothetical protein [Phycisphaerales bacterium]